MATPSDPTCNPRNNFVNISRGIAEEMIAKAIPRLMTLPALKNIVRTLVAIPRLCGGMTSIIIFALGEKNNPEPSPMISIQRINSQIAVDVEMNIIPKSPPAEIAKPIVVNPRLPYLSASLPLIGAPMACVMAKGVKKSPALIGSNDSMIWKKKVRRKATAPLAIAFNKTLL